MPDDEGIMKAFLFVATAVATVVAPPVGASMAISQTIVAAGTEVARHCVKDEDVKEVLRKSSDSCAFGATGASVGGAAHLGKK